ncbi:MAG TPA: hypothetical protein VNJ08_03625 [Bacteriovoracaceae bacterium]|nr:hypothetical protein [Bacteriovoracaceae bacterium]
MIIFFISFIILSAHGLDPVLKKKYPYSIMTNDFGILTEKNLLEEIKDGNAAPYNPKIDQPAFGRWQCFPKKDVRFDVETWKGNDPWGPADNITEMCLFSIEVKNVKPSHYYGGRRAYRLSYCNDLKDTWNNLVKGQNHVCLNGFSSAVKDGEVSWVWNKLKTHKGCSAYWGYCK